MIAIVFNLLRPAGIALLGFSSANLIKQRQAQIPEISLSEAHDLYLQKKFSLLMPVIRSVMKKATLPERRIFIPTKPLFMPPN
jgi:hypothetical protein